MDSLKKLVGLNIIVIYYSKERSCIFILVTHAYAKFASITDKLSN